MVGDVADQGAVYELIGELLKVALLLFGQLLERRNEARRNCDQFFILTLGGFRGFGHKQKDHASGG